jgi:hypothetical protein
MKEGRTALMRYALLHDFTMPKDRSVMPCHVNQPCQPATSPYHVNQPCQPASAVLLAFRAALFLYIRFGKLFQDKTVQKIAEESQLENTEKQFHSVEWKQFRVSNLQEITRVEFTRVIIDKLLIINYFHSTGQQLRPNTIQP